MPNILFWNLGKQNLAVHAAALARDNRADIVVLAECPESIGSLLAKFNADGSPFYDPDPGFPERLTILSLYPARTVGRIIDSFGISIRHYFPPVGLSFSMAAVHLQSKLYQNDSDQSFSSTRIARTLQEAENRVGHSRTIVIGDFNMDPFEPGMIAAGGLHATMDRRIALQGKRAVQKENYKFFYNPMWNHLGDEHNSVPGSYFYRDGTHTSRFWHIFDQVLLRPSILPFFSDGNAMIITNIRGESLLSASGRPDKSRFSDHLPIILKISNLEEEAINAR